MTWIFEGDSSNDCTKLQTVLSDIVEKGYETSFLVCLRKCLFLKLFTLAFSSLSSMRVSTSYLLDVGEHDNLMHIPYIECLALCSLHSPRIHPFPFTFVQQILKLESEWSASFIPELIWIWYKYVNLSTTQHQFFYCFSKLTSSNMQVKNYNSN